MKIITRELFVPRGDLKLEGLENLRSYFASRLSQNFKNLFYKPIRFVVSKTSQSGYNCEIDSIVFNQKESSDFLLNHADNIFEYRKRNHERTDKFVAVLVIPTGIDAEIGGHCGDGNPVARLIASACDVLITHPNVVNASDINEMTENTLYVEGSILTRLLTGQIGLQKVRSNKVLVLMDSHEDKYFNEEVINAVSSARVTLGMDCDVHEMKNHLESTSFYSKSGRAIGEIKQLENLFEVVKKYRNGYDAIGLSTFIKTPKDYFKKYFEKDNIVNPWGGIEAMLTHSLAETFGIPCAHSPMASSEEKNLELGIVDPRKAPETASVTYLHCILKGLHRSPKIVPSNQGLTVEDVSCLIIPDGCVGLPTLACLEQNIPVIAVRGNKNRMKNDLSKLPFGKNKLFVVDNYLEAVGIMKCLKSGVSPSSIHRPISHTKILN